MEIFIPDQSKSSISSVDFWRSLLITSRNLSRSGYFQVSENHDQILLMLRKLRFFSKSYFFSQPIFNLSRSTKRINFTFEPLEDFYRGKIFHRGKWFRHFNGWPRETETTPRHKKIGILIGHSIGHLILSPDNP